MRVVVSGVNGFVGVHLVRELVTAGHRVVGLSMGPAAPAIADLIDDYVDQDLAIGWPDVGPDAIVHLAGLSAVGPSFAEPQRYLETNSAPVTLLCEGLLASGRSPRIVAISTGAVYAPGIGLAERAPTIATSPYAVSKLLVETQCAYYRRRGLDLTVMRPFNHIGPGQQQGFLLPDLIAGVENLAEGEGLTVGNLDTRRDYTDVRDVVRAYRLAVERPHMAEPLLNVCSGSAASGGELLAHVAAELGVAVPSLSVDPARLRPDDPEEIRGDNSLIRKTLDWRPQIDLVQTVRETVAASAAARATSGSA